MADLQELLARLTSNDASSTTRTQNPATTASYQEPFVSSPLASPPLAGPQPRHASAIMSPNMPSSTSQTPAGDTRSTNLLNLLKFSQPSATSPQPTSALSLGSQSLPSFGDTSLPQTFAAGGKSPAGAGREETVPGTDPVSSFGQQPQSSATPASTKSPSPSVTSRPAAVTGHSTGSSSQTFLLNLLNQAKPSQPSRTSSLRSVNEDQPRLPSETTAPHPAVDDLTSGLAAASLGTSSTPISKPTPSQILTSEDRPRPAGTDVPAGASKPREGIFSYVNPFEQLHASSPRNQTPIHAAGPPSRSPKVETLQGEPDLTPADPDMPTRETVSQAVNEVGQSVDKEVENVLAEITREGQTEEDKAEFAEVIKQSATEIKDDLKDDQTRKEIEEILGKPMTNALEEVAEDLAADTGGDSWESADAEETAASDEVHVYNFPMKPFVSIDIKDLPMISNFRSGAHSPMARLKKEFDQNDRSLVAANERYFAYVSPKHGGFRVLQQADGSHKQLFSESRSRVVNISLSSTARPSAEMDTVLGTGVDGSVFWTLLSTDRDERFSDNLEERSFIFPPFPVQDDNTSGGQLKTRARKSSKNPNYFAIGRGKSIHVIWSNVASTVAYTDLQTRVCNSERYLRDRSLKISTGKAGKDFTFSQCDTVIVSLDKTGKMRFWDVRPLIAPANGDVGRLEPIEVKTPITTLPTTSPANKSWPTSVMFIDKERPYNKGIALRYLIVGMKQNHTLQLWDLCLGKAVQEINLPHENESDGICSVTYHPQSNVISVGHPTRNSIYFIHLSAPRYTLPPMSQAKFLEKTENKDPSLPKIESTAIMTGIREYSFAQYGDLRSFEILSDPTAVSGDTEGGALFDLYVMHSKGVCTLTIKREDLGWGPDNNVLNPIDALKTGAIDVSELKPIDAPEPSEPSVNGDHTSKRVKLSKESSVAGNKREKEAASSKPATQKNVDNVITTTLNRVEAKKDVARAAIINGTESVEPKLEKKKKKGGEVSSQASNAAASAAKPIHDVKEGPPSYAKAAASHKHSASPSSDMVRESGLRTVSALPTPPSALAPAASGQTQAPAATPGPASGPSPIIDAQALRQLEDNVTATLSRLFNGELDSLYRKFDEDKRVQDAAGAAKQDAVLRLVSSTLTDNVEKSLSHIVSSSLELDVLPSLSDTMMGALERKMDDLSQELRSTIFNEHKGAVANATASAIRDQAFQNSLGAQVSRQITAQIDTHVSGAIEKSVMPVFSMAVNTVQQMAGDLEQRMTLKLQHEDAKRHNDALKLDQLTGMVRVLNETLQSMASTQVQLAEKVVELQQQLASSPTSHRGAFATSSAASEKQTIRTPPKTEDEIEADAIKDFLNAGQFESAVSKWVQSPRQVPLFANILSRCDLRILDSLSPLVALSAAAALTQSLEAGLEARLVWLERLFDALDPTDGEVRELVPRIMDIASQRLQTLYMQLGEAEERHPMLRKIVHVNNRALTLKRASLVEV